jgi:hypothetical protein
VRFFFLIGSLVAGAAFTVGANEAALAMGVALAIIALGVWWARKNKHVEKAAVPTEYSEAEIRELYSALSLARSSAPFVRTGGSHFDSRDQ